MALRDPRDILVPRPGGFGGVLGNPDFRLMWSAQIASQLADKFLMFSLLILSYTVSGTSTQGATLFLAYTLPSVFLSPFAGVYADRHNKKLLMFWTNAIRGGLILLIPLSRYSPYFQGVTWHLLVITFLFAAVGQVFAPAEAASIPFIVNSEGLMTATSVFTSTVMLTLLVAVPLSTLAVRFLGQESPYWAAALLFFLAAGLILLIRTPLRLVTHVAPESPDLLYELREGVAYIASRPEVRTAVLQLSLTITIIFSVFVVAPQYMSTVLHLQARDVYLILGPAESVGMYEELFKLVDKKAKIYTKEAKTSPRAADFIPQRDLELSRFGTTARTGTGVSFNADILKMADRIMLSTYAPAAVVVDHNFLVQQFRGRTDLFLEHTPGPATLNLIQLARPNLVPDLRATIRRAIKTDKPARAERAKVTLRGKNYEINIQVVPFKSPGADKSWFLVIFDESTSGAKRERLLRVLGKTSAQSEATELRRELAASKDSLQTIIEEHEATNEELKAANEEIESSNEELQSTNEELETAKEELQSTNEELTTLNEELSNRNLEMMQMTNELKNLLASIQMPIVMVDNALTVRRATPAAREAFNILPTDIGRPLGQLRPNIDVPDLENILRDVIDTLSTRERKVTDKEGREYSLRVRPYRTTDNKIDGAVLTLVDIDGAKKGDASKTENRTKNVSSRK